MSEAGLPGVTTWRHSLLLLITTVWILLFLYGNDLKVEHRPDLWSNTVFRQPRPRADFRWQPPRSAHDNKSDTGDLGDAKLYLSNNAVNNTEINKISNAKEDFQESNERPPGLRSSTKTMLYFTPYFSNPTWEFGAGGPEHFEKQGCRVTDCFITNNKSYLTSMSQFDAILFHMRDMSRRGVPKQSLRRPEQRYVMMLMESPMNDDTTYPKYKDFFNLTMTYRDDSDLPRPYAWVAPKDTPLTAYQPTASEPRNWRPYSKDEFLATLPSRPDSFHRLASRKKGVAWVVSNCNTHSGREDYVEELSKHISVSIMGNCGAKCKQGDKDICDLSLVSNFKFYLSFENSLCQGYMTEKIFKRLDMDLLPIVMGLGNYSRNLPPHSYIDIMDYKSPKELANHLKRLDQDKEEYLSYFWWKDYYKVISNRIPTICKLCEILHDPNYPMKSYDMEHWWRRDSEGHQRCLRKEQVKWQRRKQNWSDFAQSFLQRITSGSG